MGSIGHCFSDSLTRHFESNLVRREVFLDHAFQQLIGIALDGRLDMLKSIGFTEALILGGRANHARKVRKILNAGGLDKIRIFASGDLDENKVQDIESCKAPIDGYGIGTRLTTSADAPTLNCVYKLQEYAGRPRRKLSEGKSTLPGCKQVYRNFSTDQKMTGDTLALDKEDVEGEPLGKPLIEACMRQGKRCRPAIFLNEIRERAAQELNRLPEPLRSLQQDFLYPVEISNALKKLAESLDRKLESS